MLINDDPRGDARAADLLSADVGEVAGLSTQLRGICDQIKTTAQQLRGASDDRTWRSGAAQAFREKLGSLPGELDTVFASYDRVAWALWRYENELAHLQPAFRRLAGQLDDAHRQVSAARQAQATAHDPSAAQPAVDHAHGQVIGLNGAGGAILDSFAAAREACRTVIASAAGLAFGSWFERYVVDDAGNFMGAMGDTALNIGQHIIKAFHDLPGDIADLAQHPSWEHLGKLGRDLSTVVAVLTLVAAPFAAPAVLGALGATTIAANLAGTAGDAGQGKWGDVFTWDLLGFVPAGKLSGVGRSGIKSAEGDLRTARTASGAADGAVLDNQVRGARLQVAGAVEADRARRIAGAVALGIGSTPAGALAGLAAARQAQRAAISASITRLQAIDHAATRVRRLEVGLEVGALRAEGAVHAGEHGVQAAQHSASVSEKSIDAGKDLIMDAAREPAAQGSCHVN